MVVSPQIREADFLLWGIAEYDFYSLNMISTLGDC